MKRIISMLSLVAFLGVSGLAVSAEQAPVASTTPAAVTTPVKAAPKARKARRIRKAHKKVEAVVTPAVPAAK